MKCPVRQIRAIERKQILYNNANGAIWGNNGWIRRGRNGRVQRVNRSLQNYFVVPHPSSVNSHRLLSRVCTFICNGNCFMRIIDLSRSLDSMKIGRYEKKSTRHIGTHKETNKKISYLTFSRFS